ncbi:DUF4012 domain-containing protein [Patescibacteria group bacterium]|nr:DUF4012 domain-containing protein [Patescibacteria group bacterium]MBU1922409.1 DUF4012 domain-containing protein [Patescibacteria group bacterium]
MPAKKTKTNKKVKKLKAKAVVKKRTKAKVRAFSKAKIKTAAKPKAKAKIKSNAKVVKKKPIIKKTIVAARVKPKTKPLEPRKIIKPVICHEPTPEIRIPTKSVELSQALIPKKTHHDIPVKIGSAAKSPYVVDIYYENPALSRLEAMERTNPAAAYDIEQTLRGINQSLRADLIVADHEIDAREIADDFKAGELPHPFHELYLVGVAEALGMGLCKLQQGLIWPFSKFKRFVPAFVDSPLKKITTPITIEPPRGWIRALASLAGLGLVFILPFQGYTFYKDMRQNKAEIEGYAEQTKNLLQGLAQAQDLDQVLSGLAQAEQNITLAQNELNQINNVVLEIASIIPKAGKKVKTAEALLSMGDELVDATTLITKGLQNLLDKDASLIVRIDAMLSYLEQAKPAILKAQTRSGEVDAASLGAEYEKSFNLISDNLTYLSQGLDDFIALGKTLEQVLGKDREQRYLFIFENNNEMRATGGFMGSFALIDIDRGEIKTIEVPGGGTYDMQGSLDTDVFAPEPLRLIAERWELQDANWFSDFPTSARKITWFYEHSGGATPDGVVVVTATFMERLLEIFGPVDMPEYGRTFSADNFIEEVQKIVELEYDKEENKPKKVIGELTPIILQRLLHADREQLVATMAALEGALREKQILIYHQNDEVMSQLDKQDWTGRIKQTDGDYLMVVNTNIAGGKTDGVIDQRVDLDTKISDSGEIMNTLKITRTHMGVKNQGFSGVNNVNYLRVYVPKGAELLTADGFSPPDEELFDEPVAGSVVDPDLAEIEGTWGFHHSGVKVNNEFGKTVFGAWTQTKPGEQTVVEFRYRLPFRLETQEPQDFVSLIKEKLGFPTTRVYSLFWQKQAGAKQTAFNQNIALAPTFEKLWANAPELLTGGVSQNLANDVFYALLLEKRLNL